MEYFTKEEQEKMQKKKDDMKRNQHKIELQDLMKKLQELGYSELLNYVNKKLKSYNHKILQTLGKPNDILKQEKTESNYQSEEEENQNKQFVDEDEEWTFFMK